MKVIAETPSNFQLLGPRSDGSDSVAWDRPSVIEVTEFILVAEAHKRLVRLAEVNDEATDADWAEHLELARAEAPDEEAAVRLAIDTYPHLVKGEEKVVVDTKKEAAKKKVKGEPAGDDKAKGSPPPSGQPNSKQPALDDKLQ